MLFKRSDELKVGMRLARPIYNKSGVLLYERNSLLSPQGIESIKNFGLIGIYILEPAEPVPPMSKADLEFERFQSMCVFAIADETKRLRTTGKQQRTHFIVADIIKNYGRLNTKMNFIQSLRSNEDYFYKHSMSVAILSAMMGNRLKLSQKEQNEVVMSALLHDIGKLDLPIELALSEEREEEDEKRVRAAITTSYLAVDGAFPDHPAVKRICLQAMNMHDASTRGRAYKIEEKILTGSQILFVANTFDAMTAMRFGQPPASEVAALRQFLEYPDIFNPDITDALIGCINILHQGVSVELNNGEKALVLAENAQDIMRPMLLSFKNNTIIDLSDKHNYGQLEIVDIMKTLDNRHVMDISLLKSHGISVDEAQIITPDTTT